MSDKKPVIPTGFVTPYGTVLVEDAVKFADDDTMRGDLSYVPGYSEQVRAFEVAQARRNKGESVKVPVLPVKLHWARRAHRDGSPDTRRLTELRNVRFRPVTADDIGQSWLTELPPGAYLSPDNTVVKDDVALMVQDGAIAAQREAAKTAKWMKQSGARQEQALMAVAEQVGSQAEVVKE